MNDILEKKLLPTELDTRGIRAKYSAEILRQSFFSATVAERKILEKLRIACQAYANGLHDAATCRAALMRFLDGLGYEPKGKGLKDLSSARRLDLILRTQKRMADSLGRLAGAELPGQMARYPAWRLVRTGARRTPRDDWPARWRAAGDAVGWAGASRREFVALKTSPIWGALGAGAGGFSDALGNPYPPFAFSSGLGWERVSADEAAELHLIEGLPK